jgi:replicative DNA helicase
MSDDRALPISIEAEQAVLGAIMMNNAAFESVSGILSAEHFSEEIHAGIYTAMSDMISEGRVASPINLIPSFEGVQLSPEVSARQYIANLAGGAVSVVNAIDYARTIVDLSNRRTLITTARDLIEAAFVSPIHIRAAQLATAAIENLDAVIVEEATGSPRVTIAQAADDVIARVQAAAQGDPADILATGLHDLDQRMNGGIEPGELVLLAGRPSMGKSAVALSIALNVASREVDQGGVAFFSLEMQAAPLASRAISALCYFANAPIEYRDMRGGTALSSERIGRMVDAQRLLRSMPIVIEQQAALTLSQISQRARRIQGRMLTNGVRLRLIVVDHLGLIGTHKRDNSREREVSDISKGLKSLAKDLGVAVLALAQLNRKIDERKLSDRRPMLSDLRESGSLEQDADTVIGLFRESYYLQASQDRDDVERFYNVKNNLEALLLKSRQGPTGIAQLFCAIGSNAVHDITRPTTMQQMDFVGEEFS